MENSNKTLNLRLDLRILAAVLVAVIATMLLLWQPWKSTVNENEVIKVTGETTLKAEPDEYSFSPRYTTTNKNKELALQHITAKSEEVTTAILSLGVHENNIKTSVDSYENKSFPERPGDEGFVYNLTVNITLSSKTDAQKIQNYLTDSGAEGSITPYATFSETKRKELENQARDEATNDARRKAEQSADNLGFKLGKVKSVEDGAGFGGVEPFAGSSEFRTMDMSASPAIQVMPGQNELKYTVTVIYYVR